MFAANDECHLTVFDAIGRLVESFNFQNGVTRFTLDGDLPTGYYFCRILNDQEVKTEKIVLTRCE